MMNTPTSRNSPFTLIELLAVIAIIVILAGIVVGGTAAAQRKAARAKARSEISKFELAVEQYRREWGYLPQDNALSGNEVTRNFLESIASSDGTPYLNIDELRFSGGNWRDPFGRAYLYEQPGTQNPDSYDVWSEGSDASSAADDIGNFNAE